MFLETSYFFLAISSEMSLAVSDVVQKYAGDSLHPVLRLFVTTMSVSSILFSEDNCGIT